MLLEGLRNYALRDADVPPAGYQKQAIRYIIRLTPEGRFVGLEDTADPAQKLRGMARFAPSIKRTVGVVPKLLADTGEYVLGIARNDPTKAANPQRVARQHAAFIELANACAAATDEPSVQAVAAFLGGKLPDESDLGPSFDASATVTFRVNDPGVPEGILPVSLPSVQAFWAARLAPDDDTGGTEAMPCIVCGVVGPVLERHPFKIKGIPGGQVLKDLISANAAAFLSYGLKASQIAPTCPACAEAYGNGLNALLASDTTRLRTKELAYAFWTDAAEEEFGPVVIGLITAPQAHPGEVRALLTAHWSGKREATSLDPVRFHAAVFGASGARVVVKDWIDTTVGEARDRMARYFALQELVDWNGGDYTPVSMRSLVNATTHETGTPPPIVGKSLVRLALAGAPLPYDLLLLAIQRNRAEQRVTRPRAMLIKMVLGSRGIIATEVQDTMKGLNEEDTHPAYVCGRLLETLSQVQLAALGKTNTTVISRYYGTASAAPQTVFPNLLRTANAHLRRMQRDKGGAHNRLDKQLQQILELLDGRFPSMFNAEDQGRFALGFYHQRAHDRARIEAAVRAKRERGAKADDEDDDLTPEAFEA